MKNIITLIVVLLVISTLHAQTIIMPTSGTTSQTITCGTTYNFYDSGNTSLDYSNNESGTIVFCSSDPCKNIQIQFTKRSINKNDEIFIYDGPNVSSPLIASYTNLNNNTSIVTLTASGNCLTVRFASNNSGTRYGWESTVSCYTPSPSPANDICCNAVSLPVNASCVFTASGITATATQSLPGCGGGNADDDVWYSFVATGPIAYVTVAPGASYNATVEVFSQTSGCGTLTSMQCVNVAGNGGTENVSLTGLTVGQTYYIRVFHNGVGASATPNFNICITNTIPCILGTGVTAIGTLSSPYSHSGTTCSQVNDITSSNVSAICGSSLYYGGEDYIYTFTPAVSGNVSINVTSTGSWMGVTLYQGCPTSGGTCVANAQGSSGNQTIGCAPVIAGQTYYVVIDSWPSPTCNPYSITITPSAGVPPGTTCSNPVNIVALPYSASGESTLCFGNDYTNASTGSCGSLYESGEDKVYRYVATGPECIGIQITGASTNSIGFQVYSGCPGTAGTTCIGNFGGASAGTLSGSVVLPSAGTYFIIVDTWAAPSFANYNISISALGGSPANDPCSGAIPLVSGVVTNGDNSCSSGVGEPGAASCWTTGALNTVWYSFNVTTGYIKVRTNPGTLTNTQIALYSGTCGSLTQIGCNNDASACGSSGTLGSEISMAVANGTYYIRVDGTTNLTGSFQIIAMDGNVPYPPIQGQDCALPNPVCNQNFTVSNPGFSGFGNNCDLPTTYCLASAERNVVWYTIPINAAGTLSFDIVPNDFNCTTNSSTDYDFALFRLDTDCDGNNTDGDCCNEIFTGDAIPLACNYSALGVTGLGPGGNAPGSLSGSVCPQCSSCPGYNPSPTYNGAYEPTIAVSAGQTYLLAVSNFSSSTSGFRIDFRTSPINYTAGLGVTSVSWTGGDPSLPTEWNDVDNWGGCTTPSCTRDAQVFPFLNQPIIQSGTTMYARDVTIQAGATLTMQANSVLEICGSFNNLGSLNMHPTSILRFVGSATQSLSGNLTGANALGSLEITKTGGQVNLQNDLTMKGNFTTSNVTSIFNTNGRYITLGGHFANANGNSTFMNTGSTGTLDFNGSALQNYNQGGTQLDLNAVVLHNSGGIANGVNLLSNMFIKAGTGTLTLVQGTIITNANRVDVANITPGCVNAGNATSFVAGNLWRSLNGAAASYDLPVGSVAKGYQRANINFTTATTIPRLQARFDNWPSTPPTQGGTECATTYNLPSEDNGYWTINASANPMSGIYTCTLYPTNATNTAPANGWTVIKSNDAGVTWLLNGTCAPSTAAVVVRTGMNGFSQFGAGQATMPLPIELLSFTGYPEGARNRLEWITASEINNDYFTLERSTDGMNFIEIKTVDGAGNSNVTLEYFAYDETPNFPISYYRLKQTDFNGTYSYSNIITIASGGKLTDAPVVSINSIYPNPSTGEFFLDFTTTQDCAVQIEVIDMMGRMILNRRYLLEGNTLITLDGTAWAAGVYAVKVRISGNDDSILLEKVIKN